MHILLRVAIVACATFPVTAQAETLTLETAIARALAAAPEGAVSAARLDALRAGRAQAAVKPNPSVEIYGENVAGTGPYSLVDGAEVTATYAQTIERGGKRAARVALANEDISVAEAEALVQRLDIAQRVQAAYVEALTAEAMIEVATERLRIARLLEREVARRVREGRDPLFAGTRAETRVAEAEVDVELAEHARDAALTRLTALWGGSPAGLTLDTDEFFELEAPAPSNATSAAELAAHEARVRRATAAIAVEQARRVQDPTVRGGLRYLNQTGDVALVGGISIPLARNDTNRANIERATAERRRAEAEMEVVRVARMRELRLAEERVHEARLEAAAIRDRVLPGALRTLEQVRDGFARGGFRFIDLDEAFTELATVRGRLAQAIKQFHEARIEVDRLTGRFSALAQQEAR